MQKLTITYNVSETIEIPSDKEVKDVYVKWNEAEVVFTDGTDMSLTFPDTLPEELHDFKRPDYIAVRDNNDKVVWRS